MSIIDEIMRDSLNKKIPRFKAGDTVRVYLKIKEGEKERIQYYEGVVIAIHNNGISTTFKVRKESYGVGVERTFPLFSPLVQKIEVKRRGDVRRAKLYYLRKLSGKKARIKERKDWMLKKSEVEAREAEEAIEQEVPVEAEAAETTKAAEAVQAEKDTGEAGGEETAEAAATKDAAADSPVVEEEDTVVEPVAETAEPATSDESVPSEDEGPKTEQEGKKSGKGITAEGEGKEEKTPRKPRKKKSEPSG